MMSGPLLSKHDFYTLHTQFNHFELPTVVSKTLQPSNIN